MTLVPGDPLAHRALDSLLRAEASVRRRLSADLEREGLSASGFSVLVILTVAGGELQLRVLRARLRTPSLRALSRASPRSRAPTALVPSRGTAVASASGSAPRKSRIATCPGERRIW